MRLLLTSLLYAVVWAQPAPPPAAPKPAEVKPGETKQEPEPVVTQHEFRVRNRTLKYTATAGRLPIVNTQNSQTEAHMFFVAFTLDNAGPKHQRPLMFCFNGGPGAASVWLHLGMIGPKRARMMDDGSYPPPPFVLENNAHTFLDFADLVFIDPIGTGYSRAATPELGKKFWGVQGDIASVGDFIRLYLTRYDRWSSPLFETGESYGTFRAAGLAAYLVERGVAFNGVILISSILNFQTARFNRGNDLPYLLFLPTYAATAWYHKKVAPDLQKDLKKTLKEAEDYASGDYPLVLAKGDRLTDAERGAAIDKLHRLTGLEKRWLDQHNLRIEIQHFTKELRRSEGRTVGRLDSRIEGVEGSDGSEFPQFDPSMTAIRPPYTALFLDYARTQLNYKSDLDYYVLGGGIGAPWDYGPGGTNAYADTSDALRQAFAKNPYMKLYVGQGYYDLATPYFATEYTLSHMGLPAKFRDSITRSHFEAGHMFYIHVPSLERVSREIAEFVRKSIPTTKPSPSAQ